ncbi:MAG: response regulator transcription factor [Bacteroidetes bacterium]|nr:response regulator transcription factor [Bacteroidota bacterium]
MKVLIADESEIIRKRITKLLSSFNKIELIAESESARDTAESIRTISPDVVILDIQFKDGTALDVLHEIGKDDCKPFIIVLTNYNVQAYIKEYSKYGVKYFLDKSKDFIKIKDIVKELISVLE